MAERERRETKAVSHRTRGVLGRACIAIALSLAASGSLARGALALTVRDLDSPANLWSEGLAINDAGQVAFNALPSEPNRHGFNEEHAYRWEPVNGTTDLGEGRARDMSVTGEIVGESRGRSSSWGVGGSIFYVPLLPNGEGLGEAELVDARGDIIGTAIVHTRPPWCTGYCQGPFFAGYLYTPEGGTEPPPPVGDEAINDSGEIVGGNEGEAATWTRAGGTVRLGRLPGWERSYAEAVNDAGDVAGILRPAEPELQPEEFPQHIFYWEAGRGMLDAGTIPGQAVIRAVEISQTGQVVGSAGRPWRSPLHERSGFAVSGEAFSWTRAGGMVALGALPGDCCSVAVGVNDHGEVAGDSGHEEPSGNRHESAFVWTQERGLVQLPGLGGCCTQAAGINDSGQVVGAATDASGKAHAVVWETFHPTSTTESCASSPVVAGRPTTCTATVTDAAGAAAPQIAPGGSVAFASSGPGTFSGGGSCTLAESAPGVAQCSIEYTPRATGAEPIRSDMLTASYREDSGHVGSGGKASVQVLSIVDIPSGTFVIGDEDASVGSRVVFAGALWPFFNRLSEATQPPLFDGFASGAPYPPRCGEAWTAPHMSRGRGRGGTLEAALDAVRDSTRAPDGALPVAVSVASLISRSTAGFGGNTVGVVLVRPDRGVRAGFGGLGSGTVVAQLCP